jgi:hypothetical protein
MTDSLELDSLWKASNVYDEAAYEKVEYIQLADQQGSNYSAGQVTWLTDMAMKNHVVYSESYLQVPLKVTLGAAGRIAVKNSLLSLIQGIQIESGAGTVICNEQMSTPIINNLRLLIDSSVDFIDGNELMYFGKDQAIEPNVSGADFSLVGGVPATVTSKVPGVNPYENPALASRISVFRKRATVVAAVQQYVAYIPLKFLHDFFRQMDFPIINLSLRITMNFAGTAGYTSYQPYTTPAFPAHSSLGPASAPAARVAPAAFGDLIAGTLAPAVAAVAVSSNEVVASFADKGVTATPKLFLKTVYFRAKEAQALKDMIVKGFSKKLTYTCSNYYPSVQSADINYPVVQGIIRPTRMWVLPLATGTLASSANCFPSSIGANSLTDTNIMLNGNNFYQNEFKTQYQYYKEFKTQCIGAGSSTACGSPICFSDWLSGINPYVFDLSRNPTVKSNNQCTITLVTKLKDSATGNAMAGSCDLVCVIERLQTCELKVSEGGVEVVTKSGADQ